jgi:glycosyltransferase involved in cell wall biosynthesis
LKILFLYHNPTPSPDAGWTRIEFLSEFLTQKGYEVSVAGAFSYKTLANAGVLMSKGIRIINLCPVIGLTDIFSLAFNIMSSTVASFFILAFVRPDIIIISLPNGGYGVGSYMIANFFKRKIVTDYRDEWEDYLINEAKSQINKYVYKRLKNIMTKCYYNSNVLIAVTQRVADSLKKRGLRDMKVIPNGADTTLFRPMDKIECRDKIGISKDDFVLIYSGGVGGYYRLDVVLRALQEFVTSCEAKARLLIVGHGTSLQSLLKLADDIGLKDKVTYLGKTLDKHKLVTFICASDVGIVPYDSNPLWKNSVPAKCLEYFACGLPVIATAYKDSLLGKMIIENELGALAEPENPHLLYESLKILKANTDLGDKMIIRGPSFIKRHYDRCKIASEFYNVVLQCLYIEKNNATKFDSSA